MPKYLSRFAFRDWDVTWLEGAIGELEYWAGTIRSFDDLLKYAESEPVMRDILAPVARILTADLRTEQGIDWKAVRARNRRHPYLGSLRLPLTPESLLTSELCKALQAWIVSPSGGRDIHAYADSNPNQSRRRTFPPRAALLELLSILENRGVDGALPLSSVAIQQTS